MIGNFVVLSLLRSWKLTRFLTTCISATSFRIWTFSAFLYISETTRTNFFKISPHIIFIRYIKMSETFIKIDSLQHPEISWQTYPTNLSKLYIHCFDVMLIFPNLSALYIPPWLVHFSLTLSHLLNVKHWQYSHWNVLVMDICIVRKIVFISLTMHLALLWNRSLGNSEMT